MNKDTASGYIHFFIKTDCYGMSTTAVGHFFSGIKNFCYFPCFVRGQSNNFITDIYAAGFNLSLKSTKSTAWTAYSLNRHGKSFFNKGIFCINIFKICEKRFSFIPGHSDRFCSDIISFRCGDRKDFYGLKVVFCHQSFYLTLDFFKMFCIIVDQIHFIYGKYEVLNSHKGADSCMSFCLYENTTSRINKNNSEIGKRSTNCHISCVFFMSGGVCNNERTMFRCKITISNVNCDSLLSFSHQSVKKKRIVNCSVS